MLTWETTKNERNHRWKEKVCQNENPAGNWWDGEMHGKNYIEFHSESSLSSIPWWWRIQFSIHNFSTLFLSKSSSAFPTCDCENHLPFSTAGNWKFTRWVQLLHKYWGWNKFKGIINFLVHTNEWSLWILFASVYAHSCCEHTDNFRQKANFDMKSSFCFWICDLLTFSHCSNAPLSGMIDVYTIVERKENYSLCEDEENKNKYARAREWNAKIQEHLLFSHETIFAMLRSHILIIW